VDHAGGPGRAPVLLRGAGQSSLPASLGTYNQATGGCTTYCHASSSVTWTGGALGCASCHGFPSFTNWHELHVSDLGHRCVACHAGTVGPSDNVIGNHVNGTVTIQFSGSLTAWDGASCTSSCHEGGEWRAW